MELLELGLVADSWSRVISVQSQLLEGKGTAGAAGSDRASVCS